MPLGLWLKRLQSPAVSSEPLLKAAKEHCFPGAVFCSLLVQIPWGLYVTCLKRPGCKQGDGLCTHLSTTAGTGVGCGHSLSAFCRLQH